ncbi:MAG: VPLPA-CTERM sorting domain-containing protein [Gammaproteobacteria bacterium]
MEGNFGGNVGASICGNYNFGANFVNESTTNWGPGTSASRSLRGDDAAIGAVQSIASLDGMNYVSFVAFNMVFSNATCTTTCTTAQGGFNNDQKWTFSVLCFPDGPCVQPPPTVPIPAAAWQFGGALGLLGMARRRVGII